MNVLCFCSLLQLATHADALFRMVVCPFWKALPITLDREEHVTAFVKLLSKSLSEGGHSFANYDITFKRFCGGQLFKQNSEFFGILT